MPTEFPCFCILLYIGYCYSLTEALTDILKHSNVHVSCDCNTSTTSASGDSSGIRVVKRPTIKILSVILKILSFCRLGGGGFENLNFCYAHSRFLNYDVNIGIELEVNVTVHR
jgi:hypothetical protein